MTALVVKLIVILTIVTALTIVNYKLMRKMEKEGWNDVVDAENEYFFRSYPIGCVPILF